MNKMELWSFFKTMEKEAAERRRSIEDELTAELGLSADFDGTKNAEIDGYKIKALGRLSYKVDVESMAELAKMHDVEDHFTALLRWKAELNLTEWKRTDPRITGSLMGALTVTAGRPSYQIEKIGE